MDPIARKYGTAIPKNIPEYREGKISSSLHSYREHELGMMLAMVTITHNDLVPEMLANIRRGPFVVPTDEEKVEDFLTHVWSDRQRVEFENYGMEHVLS